MISRGLFRVWCGFWFAAPIVLLIAASAHAQDTVPSNPPAGSSNQTQSNSPSAVFQSETNLVLVDVVVTEKNKAVHGLDKSHFHIQEDGKDRPILNFEEHLPSAQSAIDKTPALPAHAYTNAQTHPAGGAINVLLLDALNTPVQDQVQIRKQMIASIGKIPPGTPLAIFTLSSELRMLSGFTTDTAALIKAINSPAATPNSSVMLENPNDGVSIAQMVAENTPSAPHGSSGITGAALAAAQFEADTVAYRTDARVGMTLNALEELARFLSGIPGRKNLIWFSGSFPIALDPDNALPVAMEAARSYGEQVRETDNLLNTSRIAVYPVDARGMMNLPAFAADYKTPAESAANPASGLGSPIGKTNQKFETGTMSERATMEDVASDTGGRVVVNSNDFQAAFAQAIENGASFYTVAYSPASSKADGHYHKIKLRVEGGSYQISYRRGYFAYKPGETATRTSTPLQAAISRGAPPATQIIFQTLVLPTTDPALAQELAKDPRMLSAPGGEMSAAMAGKPHQRYVIDLRVDLGTIGADISPENTRDAKMEVALVAYDSDGKRINLVDKPFTLHLTADQFRQLRAGGLPIRSLIDLPAGPVYLRIAVRNVGRELIGSLEVPLNVQGKS